MTKLAIFDCDSTLSSIEGIDELARLCGPEVLNEVEALTNAAMDGEVPLDEVFGRRIDIIRPNRAQCDYVKQLYIDTVEHTALETLAQLKQDGWRLIILSGGFKPLIEPLAELLDVERVEAVPLTLDEAGAYVDFGRDYPTTRNGGKPEIISSLIQEYSADKCIMVGDGISDLECKSIVDLFIGFCGYVKRDKVVAGAEKYVTELKQLFSVLKELEAS